MKAPRRIAFIALRRIGDLLLSTALIRSLKSAWPEAQIDALVMAGTESVLSGNPDVARVLCMQRGSMPWSLLASTARRYDLAVSVQPEDRAQFWSWHMAPRRASIVPPRGDAGGAWKHWLNQVHAPIDLHETHAVVQYLRLADALGIPRIPELVPPRAANTQALEALLGADWARQPYAVVHPAPLYRYKAWHQEGWRQLIRWLNAQGLRVMVTGGPASAERDYVAGLLAQSGAGPDAVVDLAGRLALPALTPLLENARVFVGPDTSVTHLAAACAAPTVALFGPSNPSAWGPWPQGWKAAGSSSPWVHTAPLQQHGKVWLVQGTQGRRDHCTPCMQEGCERHQGSASDCLDHLSAARVIDVVAEALAAAG